MAKKKQEKTNVMRLLDQAGVKYTPHFYRQSDAVSGLEVARYLGQDPEQLYKTLVTEGKSGEFYVFMVPAAKELDLKKAARAAGEKNVTMVASKSLLPLTGYTHGGCSPVGMKKSFPTFIDERAADWNNIMFSAGKIGFQVEMSLKELAKVLDFKVADLSE